MEKIRIGISACLLGQSVRYDGGHRQDRYITDTLGRWFDWVPVCPEVECGLGVPREAMRLVGDPQRPRLVTVETGIDRTDQMLAWAAERLEALAGEELAGFIFKSRSPSSGMAAVKVYGTGGRAAKKGVGIFAGAFMRRFPLVPAEEEGRLNDPLLRENFLERIFVCGRWREMEKCGGTLEDLAAFHTGHKLQILAHSPKHAALLDGLLAAPGRGDPSAPKASYFRLLTEGFGLTATVRKQANVLKLAAGRLKERLTPGQKRELGDSIEGYRRELIPLLVPITLIAHHARLCDEPFLKSQVYLNPHPLELMLRNHG